jgi:predicted MFS family arabinose efflux permease
VTSSNPRGAEGLALIALALFVVATDGYVLPGLLPSIASALGVEFPAAAQSVSAYSLTYALSIIPLAFVTSAWPLKTALRLGLALFAVGCLGSALATNLSLMLVARCCCGLAAAIVVPTAGAAAIALQPPNRHGRAISIIMLSMSCATAIGSPLGALISGIFGWRVTLLLVTSLAGVTLVGLCLPRPAWPARKRVEGVPSLLTDRLLLLELATAYLGFVGVYCVYVYIGPVFDRATASSQSTLALLLWLWGVASVAGSIAAAWLCDRLGAKNMVFITLVCLGVDFAIMPVTSQSFASTLASVAVWGFTGVMLSIALQRQLIGRSPQHVAVLAACFVCVLQGGIATAGAVGGTLIGFVDAHNLPLAGSAFIAAACLVQWVAVSAVGAGLARKPA